MMGFTFGFGAPMGYAAAAGPDRSGLALALYAAAILWDPGLRHDLRAPGPRGRRAGRRALHRPAVRRAAPGRSWPPAMPAAILLLALAGGLAGLGPWFYPALLLPAALLARQVVTLDIDDPGRCLRCSRQPGGRAGGRARHAGRMAADPGTPRPSTDREQAFVLANTVRARPAGAGDRSCTSPPRSRRSGRPPRTGCSERNIDPPFWAFAWPGGQALARHILDIPALVAGRRVLDFAAGGGIAAIACAMAGAAQVEAAEIDRLALAAIAPERRAERRRGQAAVGDVVGAACRWDLILCGDVCYEAPMTGHILPWLRRMARDRRGVGRRSGPDLPAAIRADPLRRVPGGDLARAGGPHPPRCRALPLGLALSRRGPTHCRDIHPVHQRPRLRHRNIPHQPIGFGAAEAAGHDDEGHDLRQGGIL